MPLSLKVVPSNLLTALWLQLGAAMEGDGTLPTLPPVPALVPSACQGQAGEHNLLIASRAVELGHIANATNRLREHESQLRRWTVPAIPD